MSDRLEEIKKLRLIYMSGYGEDIEWLIAEVERLRGLPAWDDQFRLLNDNERLSKQIESLTKELEVWRNKAPGTVRLRKLEAENAELKRNQTEVWAVKDLLAQADKRYSELMEIKNKFAKQLAASEKARWEVEKRVDQLREQSRQVSIINKNIKSLRLHHPDPDQTDYEDHISGNCSCGVKR